MWIAKIKMKHDCLIGNRCKKFKIEATANELGSYSKGKTKISNSVHQLFGEEKQIQKFIKDLKKDKNILHLENKNNTIYISENKPETPVKKYTKNIFLASTVTIDKEGYEYWEIGSFNREDLNKFINDLEKISQEFELLQIKESTAENIFFPKVLPNLTDKQKIVIDLAIKEGYYKVDRKSVV